MAGLCWLFDLDGTLVDTSGDLADAVNVMRSFYGLGPLADAAVAAMLGNGMRNLMIRALSADAPGFAADQTAVRNALAIFRAHYAEHFTDRSRLYPGVIETLAKLRAAGGRIACVSNKMGDASRGILRNLGVAEYCDEIIGDGDGFALKPAPDSLWEAVRRMGGSADHSLMVGDNWTDLESARAAGMKCVFATYGYGTPGKTAADFIIDRFSALEAMAL